MKITEVKYENGWLNLKTESISEAIRFCAEFVDGDYAITKKRKKRSLDSNAYAWVLIDKLAAALNLPKAEVYRMEIKEISGVSETVCVPNAAVKRFCETWEKNGLGWQTDVFPSKLKNCMNVVLYYGSSTYDTAQMNKLIDNIIEDCKALGIETLPPERLEFMKEEWR